jgi:transposase
MPDGGAKGFGWPQGTGAWFLFLPPYSPDLNPIEMAFAVALLWRPPISDRSYLAL